MSRDLIPEPSTGLPLYRHVRHGMERDDMGGQWVKLSDARHALNGMQSVLRSTEVGNLGQSAALMKAHKERGDILRLWDIVGNPNTHGVRQDIFERVQAMRALIDEQRREIDRLHTIQGTVVAMERDERGNLHVCNPVVQARLNGPR